MASVLCLRALTGCAHEPSQTFCEAVSKGASNEELTRMLTKHGQKIKDGTVSRIEDAPNTPSPCTYEVREGRVVSAKVLK
jgi:hypothetical protein